MMGLMVLLAFAAYLGITLIVAITAARWARRNGRRGWLWGGVAAFAMYNLVFWDWIPTVALHKYYCATEAGFWVYKTPEQWAKENPDKAGRLPLLRPQPVRRIPGGWVIYQINDRVSLEVLQTEPTHAIGRTERLLRDSKNGEILAKDTAFTIGAGKASFHSGGGLEGWRRFAVFGLSDSPTCPAPQRSFLMDFQQVWGDK